ncbi:sacsin N-terminal ATP-binding-like domain-containing protein [Parabacteroides sp. ZJ-118]|uniref:sacsin N-terminal ATP-binding-like domain-containing protein n=1 Tax=Parabacteroides sp. ZJ-118 TaxID=2709398 RepID=UPI0013ECC572|nr:hypothetical protein [Parabacteroides sp. ZJ-118]
MSDIGSRVDQVEQEQFRSIPAQRLIEKLSLLKNRKENAKKRWFWELLQNASDYNDVVSVRLIVTKDQVEFQHDGAAFSINDALNLILPDSNKRYDEIHTDNIGRFGTGFVSTHILSSIIHVKGLCRDDELYRFELELDRSSFEDKGRLIEASQEAKSLFKQSLHPTTPQTGFQTSFTYKLHEPLPTLEPLSGDDIDLDYLYDLLPYTLCFMPKVKSVSIEDRREADAVVYTISRKAEYESSLVFEVTHHDIAKELHFAYFCHNQASSVFRYEDNRIVPLPPRISKMFCGLPLIGTEDIGLPILVNSLRFEPTTEREGIELEPGSNEQNRTIMDDSVELYGKVLDYVEKHKLYNAHVLADIRRKYNGTQASKTQFYTRYIIKYKQLILTHAVVPNCTGDFINFSQVKLPFRDSKADVELYHNARFIAAKELPVESDYQKWFDSTDFTLFTEQKYTYRNLATSIESVKNIYSFNQEPHEVLKWLTQCCSYLKECDQHLFASMKLLPNQQGEFKTCMELSVDDNLPSELKNIYNELHESKGEKIESHLLDKQFDSLGIVNQTYSIEKIANCIDTELSEQYTRNKGNTAAINRPLNALYTWVSNYTPKENLPVWFRWYYPKRATLIVDMLTETQREQTLIIAQSGKMEALAELASSDLSNEELTRLIANKDKLPMMLNMLLERVDDKVHANSQTGNWGEELVYKDLLVKYPRNQGYHVIWASKDYDEPRYDFEVKKGEQTICFCDAKTTMRGVANSDSIPFFMRKSQWLFLQELECDIPYYIARVFNGDNGKIIYMHITILGKGRSVSKSGVNPY